MAEGIEYTPQILAFVLDSSQVVSYKWLSRKFSVPSNEAQRLLQIVAEQHGSSIDVIYAVSGWSKTDRHCYSVQLVPKSKLQQAKDMLDGHVSSHVYSIQPCIPKDPAELWSTEYVQSEELFKQPPELNNCLRDNRFSAVSCISITRKVPGTSSAGNALLAASKVAAPSSSSSKLLIVKAEVPTAQASTSGPPSLSKPIALGDSAKDAGTGSHGSATVTGPGSKGVVTVPNKKKTAGSGDGALANLWGRVSSKPKPTLLEAQVGSAVEEDAAPGNVDTFARAQDASFDASSDDDATNFARIRRGQVKSSSGRKRRVIIDDDMSDVEDEDLDSENIVSLSSPEVRKERPDSSAASKRKKSDGKAWDVALKEEKVETSPGGKNGGSSPSKASPPSAHVSFKEVRVDRADIVLKSEEKSGNNPLVEAEDKTNKSVHAAEKGASSAAAPGPKKRKVLKTRIDDRGREVTEVVWENNDTAVSLDNKDENCLKDADAHAHAKIEPLKAPSNRSLASANAKASNTAAQNPSNKASGNKPSGKAAPKDSQRRKISSFFQKKS